VALADRDLVNANHAGSRHAGTLDLGVHVPHLQRFDRVPDQLQFRSDFADRGLPAATADIERKASGEVWIVRQEIQPLALHCAAGAARQATYRELQDDAEPTARKVANPSLRLVVPTCPQAPTAAADGFFERRSRVTIRTSRSPNTPRMVACARKPANEYPSDSRRCRMLVVPMPQHARFWGRSKPRKPNPLHASAVMTPQNHPHESRKTRISFGRQTFASWTMKAYHSISTTSFRRTAAGNKESLANIGIRSLTR